jgi:transcriptional regulator GlxA family with amidase domain
LCGLEAGRTTVAGGFSVDTPYGLDGFEGADTVIVPACANVHDAPPPTLVEALRGVHARGARIAAVCSGAFVLAAAGLLDERRATTHWMHAEELARRYPRVRVDPTVLYVQDESVFTSAGTAAGLDLCVELVRQDHGAAVANRLARRLVIPPHRAGGQAQYVETPVTDVGDTFAELLDWAIAHLDERLELAQLARVANLSTRTLARRFEAALGMSPFQWLVMQRIRRAQHLLETTDESIERIAELVGFGSGAGLRAQFLRATGIQPLAFRRAFRGVERGRRSTVTLGRAS